jgi:hypothetical protein
MFIEALDTLAGWAQTEFIDARGLAPINVLISNRAVIGMIMSMALYEDWLLPSNGNRPTRQEIVDELADLVLHGAVRRRTRVTPGKSR